MQLLEGKKLLPFSKLDNKLMFLIIASLLTLTSSAPLRGHTTILQLSSNPIKHRTDLLQRTTRYPFHFENEAFIEQSSSIDPPTSDTTPTAPTAAKTSAPASNPTGATGATSDATGSTGSTGATGATSGTGSTGATGATGQSATAMGPLESEGDEDYIVTAEMDCPGISVEQVNANMDNIIGAISGILRSVSQEKVEVTAVDSGAAPSAEVNAETTLLQVLASATAAAGVRMTLIVRGVSEDAGKTAAYNLLNSQTGASHPTLLEALQGAGLQTLTSVSFTQGKSPKSRSKWELGPEGAGCTGKIEIELSTMEENGAFILKYSFFNEK